MEDVTDTKRVILTNECVVTNNFKKIQRCFSAMFFFAAGFKI